MKRRRPIGVAISLVVMASIALATTTAFPADRFGGEAAGHPSIGDARPVLPRPIVPHGVAGDRIVPHGFFTPPPPSHNFFPGKFFPQRPIAFGVTAPPVVYVLPPGYSESPVYYDAPVEPSVIYDPPEVGALSPPDPSTAPHTRLYRWTDEQGTLHLTDRPEAVPEPLPTRAKQD